MKKEKGDMWSYHNDNNAKTQIPEKTINASLVPPAPLLPVMN
jgi:hypothetical protein